MATTYTSNAALAVPAFKDRNYHTPINADLAALDATAAIGSLAVTIPTAERPTSASLNIKVAPGSFINSFDQVITYAGVATFAVSASTTSYVFLSDSGTLFALAAWPTTPHCRLAVVVAGASTLTSIADARIPWGVAAVNRPGAIFVSTFDATVANTVTETTVIGSGWGTATVPANRLYAGSAIRVTASGILSCTGTPTLNMKLKVGGTAVVSTGAVALAGTVSNAAWRLEATLILRTIGASGTMRPMGRFWFDNAAHTGLMEGMPSTTTFVYDTTAAKLIDISATWGTAAAGNTITGANVVIESLN